MLGAKGIATETSGMAVLSFWQVFAPYAPARILVREDDAERARRWLSHVFAGRRRLCAIRGRTDRVARERAPWSLAPRSALLAGCFTLVVAAFFGARWTRELGASVTNVAPGKLEIVRIDDGLDPLGETPDSALPEGEGIAIFRERVSLGAADGEAHFARLSLRDGEEKVEGIARLRRWLGTVSLPAGARFGVEGVTAEDEAGNEASSGFAATSGGRAGADASRRHRSLGRLRRRERALLRVGDAVSGRARRFEEASGAWVGRRLAIVIDDGSTAHPWSGAITGGHVSITMGAGSPERQRAEAKTLAARLSPR